VRRDRATETPGDLDEKRYVLMDYFSPAALADENGTVTERYAFSAFGVRQILSPAFTERIESECAWEFAFQGQFEDAETGWLDYGYRYYIPRLGRWPTKDPLAEEGGFNLRWTPFFGQSCWKLSYGGLAVHWVRLVLS
jgi:RHS repeat-associated protein